MKILVTSDTHGMYDSVSDYILTHEDIDLLIYAGDGLEDVKKHLLWNRIKLLRCKG